MTYLIGTLITRPMQDHHVADKPIGTFDLEVHVPSLESIGQSGDPKAFVSSAIAMHLASAVTDTEVPKEYWGFQPNEKLQREFNWPELLAMGVAS